MDTNEVGIAIIIITLKHIHVFLKRWICYIVIIVIPTLFLSTFFYCCEHFGVLKMCTFTWCTLNMVQDLFNNCPTRRNTKQSIYYSASSLYMFRVSTTPIISSKQNCNYSLQYCAAASLQHGQSWPRWSEAAAQKNMTNTGGCSYSFVYSWWWL